MPSLSAKRGRLTPFERMYAAEMLGWVANDEELFRLAPRTVPPLTVEKIEAWTSDNSYAYLFWGDEPRVPIGYGEINPMPQDHEHWWLGHLIIAPWKRGQGWGRALVLRLLERGFVGLGVREISLAVFPENKPAIACYERCGMKILGNQYKQFGLAGRRRMVHMGITARHYGRVAGSRQGGAAREWPG